MAELDDGWAIARATYQVRGNLTDTQSGLAACGTQGERDGWIEAYRHWHIKLTVPPIRPDPAIEEPENMANWELKPWEIAEGYLEGEITVNDVVFLFVETAQQVLANAGLQSRIAGYVNCGYESGRVCYQDPAPGTVVPANCVVALEVAE